MAVLLSAPNRFIESHENSIKDRIREILAENKDQNIKLQNWKEKANSANESINRQTELVETSVIKMRNLEDDKSCLEVKIHKLETELTNCELTKESLRRDKQTVTKLYFFN